MNKIAILLLGLLLSGCVTYTVAERSVQATFTKPKAFIKTDRQGSYQIGAHEYEGRLVETENKYKYSEEYLSVRILPMPLFLEDSPDTILVNSIDILSWEGE